MGRSSMSLLGGRTRVRERMPLQPRQRATVGIEQVAGLGVDPDGDAIMHARGIVAIGLDDKQRFRHRAARRR